MTFQEKLSLFQDKECIKQYKIINKMTTEELEKKLKISENTYIHCPTLELAKQVLSIFHKLGLKWSDEYLYTTCTNWYSYKENTTYYPFEGKYSYLRPALPTSHKIINAEEFIALHTEGEEFDLENYIPKGDLEGFPKEIIARMLECQEEQGNPRDVSVFEENISASMDRKGFSWNKTKEGWYFWNVIRNKNFDVFFEIYTKQEYQELKNNKNMQENNKKEDNSQEFRVGDKVIDISIGKIGIVKKIDLKEIIVCQLEVAFEEGIILYSLEGKYYNYNKIPMLLHYRDDYDYSIIDFNNLPKRQTPKRWRTEKGGEYHYIRFYLGGWFSICATKDDNSFMDNKNYNSGNYFRTEVEAEIIAQKLNTYFKQLIQEEHEHERKEI